MEEQRLDLQEYADAYCDGDRKKAIYTIMTCGVQYALDPYIDSMTEEDANFVVFLLNQDARAIYGGDQNYRKVIQMHSLASELGVDAEDSQKRNPFGRELLKQIGLLLAAILAPMVVLYFLKQRQVDADWILAVQAVLIGLCATDIAQTLVKFCKFCKMRRIFKRQLTVQPLETSVQPYEETLAAYEQLTASVPCFTVAEADESLRKASRQNRKVLLLSLALVAIVIAAVLQSTFSMVGCVLGCAGIAFFAFWQMRGSFRATLHTRDLVIGAACDAQEKKKLENRQGRCVLAMMAAGALYLLLGAIGIALCISLATR